MSKQDDDLITAVTNAIKQSKKYGDTLVGRAERIRELGARTSKNLPEGMVEDARDEEDTNYEGL